METVRLRLEGWEQIKEDGRQYYRHTDGRKLPKWEFEELQSNSEKIVADARRRPLSPEVRRASTDLLRILRLYPNHGPLLHPSRRNGAIDQAVLASLDCSRLLCARL